MKSKDDKLLHVLSCCELKMGLKSIIGVSYLMQISGWDLNYIYSITSNGLKCRLLGSYVNDFTAEGYIKEKCGYFYLTDDGKECLDNFVLQYDDYNNLDYILSVAKVLSDEELCFICILDIMLNEIESKYGADGLLKYQSTLKTNLKNLTSCYSDENFNNAIKLLRNVRGN